MKTLTVFFLLTANVFQMANGQSYNEKVADYIQKYHQIAQSNQEQYHIPASIILAQGILESNAGYGELADSANNHFGIKCKEQWLGMVYYKEDDDLDTLGNLTLSCFRKYDSVEESFADHALFLTSNARYARLFDLDSQDYIAWAEGLKICGYATAGHYATTLIDLINRYSLFVFDEIDKNKTKDSYAVYKTYLFIKDYTNKSVQNQSIAPVTLPDYYQGMYATKELALTTVKPE